MMTEQSTGNGHRWGQRVAVDVPVEVSARALPAMYANLKNLSLSGALMETEQELPLDSHIVISITLSTTGASHTAVVARIARRTTDAVGIEWCEFAPRVVKDLLRSPSRSDTGLDTDGSLVRRS